MSSAEKVNHEAQFQKERDHQDSSATAAEEMTELLFAKRGCCSFWIPCFEGRSSSSEKTTTTTTSSSGSWWERIHRTAESKEERWWTKGWRTLKKVREWSEIAAGPKWKTFIRRFNKTNHKTGGGGGFGGGGKSGKYQYDPLSYSLNFDEGPGQNGLFEEDSDFAHRDFSSRFAVIPMSAKGSMDLGKDGGPNFI